MLVTLLAKTILPPPIEGYGNRLSPHDRAILDDVLACAVVGAPDTVRAGLAAFASRTAADELMITAQIFDHSLRLRSFELVRAAVQ